ncbi:MAG: SH3 domain-containing protein [Myxococcota bacterium]|jgi:hypothetical protein|nr:SH3 domain-containing protein [Myxococcota bacterium]
MKASEARLGSTPPASAATGSHRECLASKGAIPKAFVSTLLFCLLCTLPSLAAAQTPSFDALLSQSLDAFEKGELENAWQHASTAAESGAISADLEYNLGLLSLYRKDPAEAVLHLERSLALAPGDEETTELLEYAREELLKRVLRTDSERKLTQGEAQAFVWWRFFHAFSVPLLSWLLLLCWSAAFCLLIVRRFLRSEMLRDLGFVLIVLSFLLALGSAGLLLGHASSDDFRPAVLRAEDAQLLDAPSELAKGSQPDDLYRGALLQILEDRGEWVRVELADGSQGWLAAKDLGEVRIDVFPPKPMR